MKRILIYLTAGALLAAALTACSNPQSQPPQSDSGASGAPSSSQQEEPAQQGKLLIGAGDAMSEVAYSGELTPEALIEAISAETGWDLTLANPIEGLQDGTGAVYGYRIGFAETSCLYVGPPDPQKDEYHMFDSTSMVLTALNSVAETLRQNLGVYEVYFTSPDGGDIDLPNAAIHLSADYIWDYQRASTSNEPLPADSIGYVYQLDGAHRERRPDADLPQGGQGGGRGVVPGGAGVCPQQRHPV